MIDLNSFIEKFIIVDSMSFASNLKETLLKKNRSLLGVHVLDFRIFTGNHLFPLILSEEKCIKKSDSIKILYACLRNIIGYNDHHILYPCLQHPSYRFDLFAFVEKIKLSNIHEDSYVAAFDTEKWNSLTKLLAAYNKELKKQKFLDYPDQLISALTALKNNPSFRKALSFELTVDENAVSSVLEKKVLEGLKKTGVNVFSVKSFTEIPGVDPAGPEIDARAFPNARVEAEYILSKLISSGQPFDRAVIASANYEETVANIRDILTEWDVADALPVNYTGGLPVSRSLSSNLFFKLLSFLKAENYPAYFISLLTNYRFNIPVAEDGSKVSRTALKTMLSEFPGYFKFDKLYSKIKTSKDDTDDKGVQETYEVLKKVIGDFEDFFKVFSNKRIKSRKKITALRNFFDKNCSVKGSLEENTARITIIDSINIFLDEEYEFISSEKTDIVLRHLKKYVASTFYPVENKPGGVRIMPHSRVFGKKISNLYITGLSAKAFPRQAKQNPLFLDNEISGLNKKAAEKLIPSSIDETPRLLYEKDKLFQTAEKFLCISYVFFDGSRIVAPSEFLTENSSVTPDQFSSLEEYLELIGASPDLRSISADTTKILPINPFADSKTLDNPALLSRFSRYYGRTRQMLYDRHINTKMTVYDGMIKKSGKFAWMKDLDKIFSASSLKDFLQCPFRYFLKKILYVESPGIPEDWDGVTWLNSASKGTLCHAILENFFNKIKGSGRPADVQKDKLQTVARKLFEEYKQDTLPDDNIFNHEAEMIIGELNTVIDNEAEINLGTDYSNRLNEASFGFREDEAEDNVLSSKAIRVNIADDIAINLCGKIDRIDVDPAKKTARLVDYKTGSNNLKEDHALWIANSENIQHMVYGMVFQHYMKGYGVNNIESGYYYISQKGQFTLELSDFLTLIDNFKNVVENQFKVTEKSRSFFMNTNNCNYCDYSIACTGNTGLIDQKSTKMIRDSKKLVAGEDI